MIIEAVTLASEYVAGLGIDAVKNRFKEKIDEKKLKSELTSYVEGHGKYNEICSLEEEIDFYRVVEYIRNNLLDVTGTRIFDPSSNKRGQARREIVNAAVAYSKANTEEKKHRVSKYVYTCLDIIRGFYESHHLSLKDFLLADIIVDSVSEEVEEAKSATIAAVDEAKKEIFARIDSTGSLFSVDKAIALAEAGKVDVIGTGIKKLLDHISPDHPYHPHFGYDYKNGLILSKPLTDEAKKLYPPKFVLTGLVKIGGQHYDNPNANPLDYAYRNQLPITMEVSKATKYLGKKLDPIQDEVAGFVGHTVVAKPPEFPPAFPCAIKVGGKSFFDYVLLRTQKIEDDGTYVISNKEQGGFYFEVKINPIRPSNPDFIISISNANNHELLNYKRFISALSKEKELHICVLSHSEDIIAGRINDLNYKTGFSSIEEEIDFLDRVCAIEDYFQVQLSPYGEIGYREYNVVLYISGQ